MDILFSVRLEKESKYPAAIDLWRVDIGGKPRAPCEKIIHSMDINCCKFACTNINFLFRENLPRFFYVGSTIGSLSLELLRSITCMSVIEHLLAHRIGLSLHTMHFL